MFEVNPVLAKVEELKQRTSVIKGYVDYDAKKGTSGGSDR